MLRRPTAIVFASLAALGLGACRESTVDLGFRPEPGASYSYRYEIEAVVTRSLEGEDDQVSELDSVLLVDQTVLAPSSDGARVEVEIRRDGDDPVSAVAFLDRAGSLQGLDVLEGLAVDALLAGSDLSASPGLPPGELAPGERWTLGRDQLTVEGRLLRLGIVDGEDVAVVRSRSTDHVDEDAQAGSSRAHLRGLLHGSSTITYDLVDGAIRESATRSSGTLSVQVSPPEGVTAQPVDGTIAYELEVRVARLG